MKVLLKNSFFLDFILRHTNANSLNSKAKKVAWKIFKKALKEVPAYKKFIGERKTRIKKFEDIPETNKINYISKYDLKERCFGGSLSKAVWFDGSSGYSGNITLWPKSFAEIDHEEKFTALFLSLLYGIKREKTLVVNTFSLGTWIAGIHAAISARIAACVINPGLRIDEAANDILIYQISMIV